MTGRVRVNGGLRTRRRIAVLKRDPWVCTGPCGRDLPPGDLTLDHIVPLARGGSNDLGNLQLMCLQCNHEKADRL